MHLPRLFSAICLLGLSSLAHADTFQQFNATNINFYLSPSSPSTTGSLTGGIVVDTTTGSVTSSTLQFNAVGGTTYNFFTVTGQGMAGITYLTNFTGTSGSSLGLFIPGNFVNYVGSQVCYLPAQASCTQTGGVGFASVSQSTYVQVGPTTYYDPYSGSLSPGSLVTAATPEPSSLLLLSTGALGLVGVVRRRFVAGRTA